MKPLLYFYFCAIFLFFTIPFSFAQWETHGPYGGVGYSFQKVGSNVFLGNANGVFISSDNGQNWNAANNGIQREGASVLAVNGSKLFAGLYQKGVYVTSTNGTSWTQKNTGLSNFVFSSLYAVDSQLYTGTPDGIFYSPNGGNSWSLKNTGIPATYTTYAFANMGDTVFAGTYGMGLYRTNDTGTSWVNVTGGFPANSFVYSLITDSNTVYAGTNSGVYKSTDRGVTWVSSNTGFPVSMWANSFAIKPGYIFAGTYSEGVFVSTDKGATWTQKNTGIPDLPFPTGLPHNYPSVGAMITCGANVLAATVNGTYLSADNGEHWTETAHGILDEDIVGLSTSSTVVFAGTARNGVFTSSDNGATWLRKNNGLTSYDIMAMTTKGASVFVSAMNQNVFRSDDNGNTWVHADSGITSDPIILKSDSSRVLAVSGGAQYTPRGLFKTINNGMHWTEIPTGFTSYISALASTTAIIYTGTYAGNLFYTTNEGVSWHEITGTLPTGVAINAILVKDSALLVGTDGQGIYRSTDHGAHWMAVNSGISNNFIKDLLQKNGDVYAATWGGGVFVSHNMGTSWTAFNSGLSNMYTKSLSDQSTKLYAGTDAGVYSSSIDAPVVVVTSINANEESHSVIFPNPGSGIIYFKIPAHQQIALTVNNLAGEIIYHYEGNAGEKESVDLSAVAKGIYLMSLKTDRELIQEKIVIE